MDAGDVLLGQTDRKGHLYSSMKVLHESMWSGALGYVVDVSGTAGLLHQPAHRNEHIPHEYQLWRTRTRPLPYIEEKDSKCSIKVVFCWELCYGGRHGLICAYWCINMCTIPKWTRCTINKLNFHLYNCCCSDMKQMRKRNCWVGWKMIFLEASKSFLWIRVYVSVSAQVKIYGSVGRN